MRFSYRYKNFSFGELWMFSWWTLVCLHTSHLISVSSLRLGRSKETFLAECSMRFLSSKLNPSNARCFVEKIDFPPSILLMIGSQDVRLVWWSDHPKFTAHWTDLIKQEAIIALSERPTNKIKTAKTAMHWNLEYLNAKWGLLRKEIFYFHLISIAVYFDEWMFSLN